MNISCDLVIRDVICDKNKDVSRSFLTLTNRERHVQSSANMALVSLAVVPMVTGPWIMAAAASYAPAAGRMRKTVGGFWEQPDGDILGKQLLRRSWETRFTVENIFLHVGRILGDFHQQSTRTSQFSLIMSRLYPGNQHYNLVLVTLQFYLVRLFHTTLFC